MSPLALLWLTTSHLPAAAAAVADARQRNLMAADHTICNFADLLFAPYSFAFLQWRTRGSAT